MTRYFTFIGVTTGQSSIVRIFPLWRDALRLGSDVEIEGCDLPLHAPPRRYQEALERIRSDPAHLGALVTTHKIDLYRAAEDLFDWVDDYARLCREVSCIARREGRLLGWAKDPISAGRSLERVLEPAYLRRTGGHVLCFGAGGAGVAITMYLMTGCDQDDRPPHICITDRSEERLRHLKALHGAIHSGMSVEYVQVSGPGANDSLMEGLPPGSLVINATGMGKDTPGSPISHAARFPENGIAWELNYRGELAFLHQAWAQRETRRVRVEDGWQYFIYGWTSVMEEVFNRPITQDELDELARIAAFARPTLPTSA